MLLGKLRRIRLWHKLMNRGAGGKNADLTSSLVQVCQETIGIECVMHLCCTESKLTLAIRSKLIDSARGESQVGFSRMLFVY
jgi:5,10-methylenetetrahydrofolate reductase